MKIAFFELEGWEEKIVKAALTEHDLFFSANKIDELNPPPSPDYEVISVFVDSRIDGKALGKMPNLKLVTTRSTGYDHVDVSACKAKNVPVAYVPGYGNNTVAEFAFGLLLNLTHKIYSAIDGVKETGFFGADFKKLRGVDLKGKTIGIVGVGRIGQEAVKIANGFGMKVVASDVMPKPELQAALNFQYVSLEDLLKNSDFISLHCLLTDQTRHLINKDNIGLIKRGAYLINTARGGLVETEALLQALQGGILAGAGLDVIEEEGETKDEMNFLKSGSKELDARVVLENHILMRMPNVLITPHTAFNSQEALERILNTTLENIKGFLAGKPINLVP